jgi:hypothetical protein
MKRIFCVLLKNTNLLACHRYVDSDKEWLHLACERYIILEPGTAGEGQALTAQNAWVAGATSAGAPARTAAAAAKGDAVAVERRVGETTPEGRGVKRLKLQTWLRDGREGSSHDGPGGAGGMGHAAHAAGVTAGAEEGLAGGSKHKQGAWEPAQLRLHDKLTRQQVCGCVQKRRTHLPTTASAATAAAATVALTSPPKNPTPVPLPPHPPTPTFPFDTCMLACSTWRTWV